MSIFEILMLIGFGSSWPFAVAKTYKTKNVQGKSILFLSLIFTGYIMGILHKIFYKPDPVIYLYILNGLMVFTEIVLYCKYRKNNTVVEVKTEEQAA